MNQDFEYFFITNYPKIKSFARHILTREEDAEDVAQDIFVKILEMPDIWQNKEDGNRYLFAITKNYILNILKHRAVELKYQSEIKAQSLIIEEFGLEQNLYAKELALIAIHSIDQMPEQRQKIFRMSREQGKSVAEIAEELQLSGRTVERHIYLAIKELKKVLLLFTFLFTF